MSAIAHMALLMVVGWTDMATQQNITVYLVSINVNNIHMALLMMDVWAAMAAQYNITVLLVLMSTISTWRCPERASIISVSVAHYILLIKLNSEDASKSELIQGLNNHIIISGSRHNLRALSKFNDILVSECTNDPFAEGMAIQYSFKYVIFIFVLNK
jgi:hypothetical protein